MSASKTYPNINQQKLDSILSLLSSNGYEVSGNNPYTVRAQKSFVKIEIRGDWSQDAATLTLTIVKPGSFHGKIWEAIDGEIRKI